ncbi:hydrogenase maturation protein HypF [Roseospira visakhapatnamensis]|uniref:Hydrogenase maturation protein HypF n=1 Tax=Roseospira visakhapatnamensis TaxID=390880 RepID=A0A7W6WAR5_9PROT|nr:hydrogenase maturation protein HypF [Roseospira visakhapatnamensis]MBB4267108.1 hydrogenase maturation protein HypF [Roseospira visakhapatnamensis]
MTPTAAVKPDFLVFSARLAGPPPPVMGMGAFLKASVSVMRDGRAHLSHPVGDLGDVKTRGAYDRLVPRMRAILGATPTVIAHDLHPDFHSTRAAQDLAAETGAVALPVQHHHAHIAAVAAEHGHVGPLLGLALDGFGLGPGGESWGGELLRVDGAVWERLGHLRRLPQPGGDVAAREPWRMGAAVLHVLDRTDEIARRFPRQRHARMLGQILERRLNSPETSSAGRLFDAACGLLNVHPVADFEGQAPMALEKMVSTPRVLDGGWSIADDGTLDTLPLMAALTEAITPAAGADLFHGTLAAALVDWATGAAARSGLTTVGLSGGCFLNRVLTGAVSHGLRTRGLSVLTHRVVSPGDPGLALGQGWIAAHHATSLT